VSDQRTGREVRHRFGTTLTVPHISTYDSDALALSSTVVTLQSYQYFTFLKLKLGTLTLT